MLRVLPFAPQDFAALDRRPYTDMELRAAGLDAQAAGEQYALLGPAFTFWLEDEAARRPLLVGGAIPHSEDHATVWAALSPEAKNYPIWITKRVKSFVETQPQARLDAIVGVDNPGAIGWARLFGFTQQGEAATALPECGEVVVMVYERNKGWAH